MKCVYAFNSDRAEELNQLVKQYVTALNQLSSDLIYQSDLIRSYAELNYSALMKFDDDDWVVITNVLDAQDSSLFEELTWTVSDAKCVMAVLEKIDRDECRMLFGFLGVQVAHNRVILLLTD